MTITITKNVMVIGTLLVVIVCTIARSSDILYGDPSVSNIHDKLGKILKTCFAEQLTALIVNSDLSEAVHRISGNEIKVPIILIEKIFEKQSRHLNMPRWPTFLLSADSEVELTAVLQQLKSTDYWNIFSTFLIVGRSKEGCQKASKILYSAWKMNLVSVFYACDSQSQDVSLYTSNPFTDRAPESWKKIENDEKLDERWTLYIRQQFEDNFCIDINWDRTKFLDGYEVKAVANVKAGETYEKGKAHSVNSMVNKLYPLDSKIFINIWEKMNVTVSIYYDQPGFFSNGTAVGFLPKLLDGTFDIAPVTRQLTFNSTSQVTELRFVLLTRHRNFLRPEEKIMNFYSTQIVILVGAVLLITWLIFALSNGGEMAPAALEVLRMVISTSLLQRLDKSSIRIYLFGVLWLVLILSCTFQGNLSSFLTRPERHDIDSWKNLIAFNYHVYIPFSLDYLALQPQLQTIKSQGNVYIIEEFDCIQNILNDSTGACLQGKQRSIQPAIQYDLHLAKDSLTLQCAYWQRRDWPLSFRTNVYLSRLVQSGLVETWRKQMENSDQLNSHEAQVVAPQIRKIKTDDLIFAFKFLALGHVLSTVIFLMELIWKKKIKLCRCLFNRCIALIINISNGIVSY